MYYYGHRKNVQRCVSCDEGIFYLEIIGYTTMQKIRKLISYDSSQDMVMQSLFVFTNLFIRNFYGLHTLENITAWDGRDDIQLCNTGFWPGYDYGDTVLPNNFNAEIWNFAPYADWRFIIQH